MTIKERIKFLEFYYNTDKTFRSMCYIVAVTDIAMVVAIAYVITKAIM
jgi:hypothetical protein